MDRSRIIRKIDTLGRIVLPIDMRKHLDLQPGSEVELSFDSNHLVIRKPQDTCKFCGALDDLLSNEGLYICKNCARIVKDLIAN